MAEFNIDDATKNGDTGKQTNGTGGGEPGSNGGTVNGEGGNIGTEKPNNGATRETDSGADAAPLGFTAKGAPRKRRAGAGRKPGSASGTGTNTNAGRKEGLVVNDREKVRNNIAGLHAMAAILTKQPLLNLNEKEAELLSNSVCDVADYHGMNLITAGGAFSLYASLCTACYMIYMPRIIQIKMKRAGIGGGEEAPETPGEARERATREAWKMDFSQDIAN